MVLRPLVDNHTLRSTVKGIICHFKIGVLPEESLELWFSLEYNFRLNYKLGAVTPDLEPHNSEPFSSFEL